MCSKKARQSNERELVNVKKEANLSLDDQRKIIDRFVDLGLAHYLEKSRDKLHDNDKLEGTSDARDFRQLLYDWAMTNENKRKRTCENETEEKFTTMKPGSIIKDSVPIENVVLLQAPYMDESLQYNLSDKAFQESGDVVGVGIDTSKQKVYKGSEAVKLIGQLNRHNVTLKPRTTSTTETEDHNLSTDAASEKKR